MRLNLELYDSSDGTLILNRWDSMSGNDMVLRISPDGSVHELSFAADDETEIWTPVDLITRLRALVEGN